MTAENEDAILAQAKSRFLAKAETLQSEISACISVSESSIGKHHNLRQNWVLYLFAKFILHMISAEALMQMPMQMPPGAQALDHFSVAGIARAAIETAIMIMYLSDDKDTDEQWSLKKLLLEMHDASNRSRMFNSAKKEVGDNFPWISVMLTDYSSAIEKIKSEITNNGCYRGLDRKAKDDIMSGRVIYIGGLRGAARNAGWPPNVIDFYLSYFSSFLHAHPVSFFRADSHKVDFHTVSVFQYDLCFTAMTAIQDTCADLRDRVVCFCGVGGVGDPPTYS